MPTYPAFDEIFVISDLHLGGEQGFQVFDQGALIQHFIESLAARDPAASIALVINGDMVDFLAEPDADYFDPANAVAKLERIAQRPAFRPVFEALKTFTARPNGCLAITLGNHDLELALPWVGRRLIELVADGAARERVVLAFDGAGFRCTVGGRNILCVHGNDQDTWNLTHYERLRRIRRDLDFGLPVEPWIPNAGTQLVIDVMNSVKRRYPFIDLLKPEFEAAVPILAALAPEEGAKIGSAMAAGARRMVDAGKRFLDLLAAEAGSPAQTSLLAQQHRGADAQALLEEAEWQFQNGISPYALAADEQRQAVLGFPLPFVAVGAAILRVVETAQTRVGRFFVDRHVDSPAFRPDHWSQEDRAVERAIGAGIDVLVAGHTHLERRLRRAGGGLYLNTGTWIRLILPSPELAGARFAETWQALDAGDMEALDALPGLIVRRPAVAWIESAEGGARARLCRVLETPPGTIALQSVGDADG